MGKTMITKKTFGPSLYFYHDKAIFDGLSQHACGKQDIHQMLVKKSVFASQDTEKGELSYYLSSFIFDYQDRNYLSEILATKPRRENVTSSSIIKDNNSKVDDEAIRQALSSMKAKLCSGPDFQANFSSSKDSFVLDVVYKDHDLTKPEVKQIETKTAQIEIFKESNGFTIRSPANEFGEKLVSEFKSSLESETNGSIQVQELTLISVQNSHHVSKFFTLLMNGIDGLRLFDVTNVKLYHPENDVEQDEETASHIKRAMLHGKQVLMSPELISLFDRGFHISSVQWVADEILPKGDRIAFEASLSKPETKEGFSFQIRGIYRYSDRTDDITQKITSPSNTEKKVIHKKLENAAELALEQVIKLSEH